MPGSPLLGLIGTVILWQKPLLYYPAGSTVRFPKDFILNDFASHYGCMVVPVSNVSVAYQLLYTLDNTTT